MLIDRDNKTPLVIYIAVPLTHNLPKTEREREREKIKKYENWALDIKNIWKLNNTSIYSLVISLEGVVTKNFLNYVQNIGLTKNILRVRQKAIILQTYHVVYKFVGHAP